MCCRLHWPPSSASTQGNTKSLRKQKKLLGRLVPWFQTWNALAVPLACLRTAVKDWIRSTIALFLLPPQLSKLLTINFLYFGLDSQTPPDPQSLCHDRAILFRHLQCVFVQNTPFRKKKLLLGVIAYIVGHKRGEEGNGHRTRKSCRTCRFAATGLWHVEGN